MKKPSTEEDETTTPAHSSERAIPGCAACHFPDGSSFPLTSFREGGADHLMVRYLHDGKPQVLWVPRGFVSLP